MEQVRGWLLQVNYTGRVQIMKQKFVGVYSSKINLSIFIVLYKIKSFCLELNSTFNDVLRLTENEQIKNLQKN